MKKLYPVVIIPQSLEKLLWDTKKLSLLQINQPHNVTKTEGRKKDDLVWLYWAVVMGCLGSIGFLLILGVNPMVIIILTIIASGLIGCIFIYESLYKKGSPATCETFSRNISTSSEAGEASLLKQFTAQLLLKPAPQNRQNTTTGPSELLFEDTLKKHFAVKAGVPFDIPGSDKQYVADFIVVDPTTGISIDVEIDEPYIASKERYGQPHHCIDSPLDDRRDQFFLNGNYIVIRFAEEQVIKYPKACCKIIAETLATVTGNPSLATPFSDLNYPIPVRRWTTKESQIMAQKNYRQRYLSSASIFLNPPKSSNQKKGRSQLNSRKTSTSQKKRGRRRM